MLLEFTTHIQGTGKYKFCFFPVSRTAEQKTELEPKLGHNYMNNCEELSVEELRTKVMLLFWHLD